MILSRDRIHWQTLVNTVLINLLCLQRRGITWTLLLLGYRKVVNWLFRNSGPTM